MTSRSSRRLAVAQWAEQHTGIARVHYPGLPSHPNYAHAKAALAGFGGMLGLELKGGAKADPDERRPGQARDRHRHPGHHERERVHRDRQGEERREGEDPREGGANPAGLGARVRLRQGPSPRASEAWRLGGTS